MENSKLTVRVRNKTPEINYGDYLVSDNKQLKIVFDLDSEWDQYEHKTARFNLDGWQFDIAFTGDTVTLPLLPAYTGELKAGLYAGDLATTTAVYIPVRDSVLAPGDVVSLDDASEMARVAAEAERVDAESQRAAAEIQRNSNEYARQFKENLRQEAEIMRQQAELIRMNNEAERDSNENARASAEAARASAESGRSSAETTRVNAEQARELAEYRRNQAEQSRQTSEANRSDAEIARSAAEQSRNTAESQRSSAELARTAADSARSQKESLRQEAENMRSSAENTRISHENSRVSAENARQQNELQRIHSEIERGSAELNREQRLENIINGFRNYMSHHDVFDVLALIREYGAKAAFRMFCQSNASLVGLDETVLRFFTAAAICTTETYTSTFYLYSVSQSPIGAKKDANENLVCIPSTNATAGRDDYADLPLFACFDVNYTIDGTTLEPVIHAIKDVYGNFSSDPSDSLVGVLQMTGWVRRTVDSTSKTVEYAAYRKANGFKPLPEAVRASDNSVRPFVIHAKYAAGYNSENKLSSVSGVQPATGRASAGGGSAISHDGQIALWRTWGNQYGGSGVCEQAFLQTMLEIKYANLGSSNIMKGCSDYIPAYTAAASETGVKRILLTPQQGADFVVGSSVSLGTASDRSSDDCYNICGISRIESINTVTVNNLQYSAITLDSDSTFDIVADSTYIVSQPWRTGSTDAVMGNDGSPTDNLGGKEPFKLQGMEIMLGFYESAMDLLYRDNGGTNTADLYAVRRAANANTSTYDSNAVLLGSYQKTSGSSGARYVKELNWAANNPEAYILPTAVGAASSTGYCAAFVQHSGSGAAATCQYLMFSYLNAASAVGAFSIINTDETSRRNATTAFIGCRAGGTGANRGRYTENTINI